MVPATFTIRCRASDELSLAIINGEPILTEVKPHDERQLWYKDVKHPDKAGSPTFALVNKATGEALQHSSCCHGPVRAIKHDPVYVDKSVLWVEGKEDHGDGFRRVHVINNLDCVFDAEMGSPARPILYRWHGGKNQQWRIAKHSAPAAPEPVAELLPLPAPEHARSVRVLCRSDQGLCLTVRDGAVVLARVDKDDRQRWTPSFRNTGYVTDDQGHRAFALVNWATGKALRRCCSDGELEPVGLAGHKLDSVDVALLWTQSEDMGEGFHGIRTVSDVDLVLDAAKGTPEFGGAHDGTPIIVFPWNGGPNQKWRMVPFY